MLNNVMIYEVFAQLLQIDLVSELTLMYQELIHILPTFSQTVTLDMILSLIPIVLIIIAANVRIVAFIKNSFAFLTKIVPLYILKNICVLKYIIPILTKTSLSIII